MSGFNKEAFDSWMTGITTASSAVVNMAGAIGNAFHGGNNSATPVVEKEPQSGLLSSVPVWVYVLVPVLLIGLLFIKK